MVFDPASGVHSGPRLGPLPAPCRRSPTGNWAIVFSGPAWPGPRRDVDHGGGLHVPVAGERWPRRCQLVGVPVAGEPQATAGAAVR